MPLLNGYSILDITSVVYRFSPSQASLEEKRVSVIKLLEKDFFLFGVFFKNFCGSSFVLTRFKSPFIFKDDFGNWRWKEVGKLSPVEYAQSGT